MSSDVARLPSATRPVSRELSAFLMGLRPGQRIAITQTVRVGNQSWTAKTEGSFRKVDYLATGISTDRVPADDIVVVAVHFAKDNSELSSITLDEQSRVELAEPKP